MNTLIDSLTPLVRKHSQCSICEDLNWLMLSNGAADLNDNVIFFGFEGASTEPSFVAKVPRLSSNAWIVQTEYEYLVEIWDRLGKDAAMYVPEPVAFFQAGKLQVLVISFVRGEGFLYSAKKQLRQKPARVQALSQEVARSLYILHEKLSIPLEDNERVPSDFHRKVETFVEFFEPGNRERQALSKLTDRYMSQTAKYKTIIQGDFWHGNIIRNKVHGNLIIVDWQYARWSTDVSLDVNLFLLAGALAISNGTDVERAHAAMDVLYQWRVDIIPAYLAAYNATDRLSLLPAKYGMMLCCVEKAVRAILDFGYNQSDGLTWRHLFSEIVSSSNDGFFHDI